MSAGMKLVVAVVWAIVGVRELAAQAQGGIGGVILPPPEVGNCISDADQLRVQAQLMNVSAGPDTAPGTFITYPQAGSLGEDLFIGAYLDHDPSPGVLDWHCTDYTYDTHLGADSEIRSFGEQLIGVPIFAAADGTVVGTDDGHPDMNTVWAGQPSNYVIVDHGGGRLGYYWHMRNGSVAVSMGQVVKAGQQLGETGSSGNSGGPHLHFEVHDAGVPVDPWAGACRPGGSLWKQQTPWTGGPVGLRDFGVCRTNPGSSGYPFASPHDPQWVTSDPSIFFWGLIANLPVSSTYRVTFIRPDNSISYATPTFPIGNTTVWPRAWVWWNWNIFDMHTITGTWTIRLELNGVVVVNAPVSVVNAVTPGFNRAPSPITATILPAAPTAADPLVCRVQQDLLLDDLDWDIVRFTYTWRVNGTIVRTRTSAGRTDMIPHHLAPPGATVTCTVTPSDGVANGATVVATTTIRTLGVFPQQVSAATGGTICFTVDMGPAQAGATYLLGGSYTGTSPGIVASPTVTIPLVYDGLTDFLVFHPNTPPYAGTLGVLSPQGAAAPTLSLPPLPPAYVGLTIHHAAFIAGAPWAATNAASFVTAP